MYIFFDSFVGTLIVAATPLSLLLIIIICVECEKRLPIDLELIRVSLCRMELVLISHCICHPLVHIAKLHILFDDQLLYLPWV